MTSHSRRQVHRAAVLRNVKAIFEAHADLALDIDPRLVGESVLYLEDGLAPAVQEWIFMDLQADTMSKAVCKNTLHTPLGREKPRGFVDAFGATTPAWAV